MQKNVLETCINYSKKKILVLEITQEVIESFSQFRR